MSSVVASVKVSEKNILDSGTTDLQILQSNDGDGFWFLLIGVAMVEGSTDNKMTDHQELNLYLYCLKQCVYQFNGSAQCLTCGAELAPWWQFSNNNIFILISLQFSRQNTKIILEFDVYIWQIYSLLHQIKKHTGLGGSKKSSFKQ